LPHSSGLPWNLRLRVIEICFEMRDCLSDQPSQPDQIVHRATEDNQRTISTAIVFRSASTISMLLAGVYIQSESDYSKFWLSDCQTESFHSQESIAAIAYIFTTVNHIGVY
jgi:hypothetical protein